jgi:hypothetical protein
MPTARHHDTVEGKSHDGSRKRTSCQSVCEPAENCMALDLLSAHEANFQCALLRRRAQTVKGKQVPREDAPPPMQLSMERAPLTKDGFKRLATRTRTLRHMIRAKTRSPHSNVLRAAILDQEHLEGTIAQLEAFKREPSVERNKKHDAKKHDAKKYDAALKNLRFLLVSASRHRAHGAASPAGHRSPPNERPGGGVSPEGMQ